MEKPPELLDAVQCFMQCMKELSGKETGVAKEMRDRKKAAKEHILKIMKEKRLGYIEIEGNYLVLKSKLSRPTLNVEFLGKAFKEFHVDPSRLQGDIDTVSLRFAEYVLGLQKHCAERKEDVEFSRKKPMSAMLMEEFHVLN